MDEVWLVRLKRKDNYLNTYNKLFGRVVCVNGNRYYYPGLFRHKKGFHQRLNNWYILGKVSIPRECADNVDYFKIDPKDIEHFLDHLKAQPTFDEKFQEKYRWLDKKPKGLFE